MLQGTDKLHPFFGRKHPFNHPINFRQFRVEIDEETGSAKEGGRGQIARSSFNIRLPVAETDERTE